MAKKRHEERERERERVCVCVYDEGEAALTARTMDRAVRVMVNMLISWKGETRVQGVS